MASFRDLLASTKASIREVTTAEADELRQAEGAVVLDVREPDEYEQGAIPGSMHIPRGTLETNIEMRLPDHSTPLVVICAGGTRSAFAAKTLNELGYGDVVSVMGGANCATAPASNDSVMSTNAGCNPSGAVIVTRIEAARGHSAIAAGRTRVEK